MKKTIYAAFIFAALGLTACNSGEEKKEENTENKEKKVETVKYELVNSESKIDWKGTWVAPGEDGEMQEMKSHQGHIKFADGTVKVQGEDISGTFAVDMTTITNEDLGEEDGKSKLEGHLASEDFFNVSKYATTDVKLKSVENGEANIVINIMGMEMEETVPVMTKMKGDKMMMTGDFAIDFAKLDFKMFSPNPEKPEEGNIDSKLDFTLDIVMKKK